MRPRLTPDQAAGFALGRVLPHVADPALPRRRPRFRVLPVPERDGDFPTPQAAINHAIHDALRRQDSTRIVIELLPGHYAGPSILPRLRVAGREVPFSILGHGADRTELCAAIHARLRGDAYRRSFGAAFHDAPEPIRAAFEARCRADPIGTDHSAVMTVEGEAPELAGLTIRNAYGCDRTGDTPPEPGARRNAAGQWSDETHQAVALMLDDTSRARCDRLVLRSFQDTLYLTQTGADRPGALFHDCRIEGDVDFIFGPATAFFLRCEIRSLGARSANSWACAPSTPLNRAHGFVLDDCAFTHDGGPGAVAGRFRLARQWFRGARATPYGVPDIPGHVCRLAGDSTWQPPVGTIDREAILAVGKCVVLRARLGGHIDARRPWDDWKGQEYLADGTLSPTRWTPRFRPAQFTGADVLRNLAGWPDLPALGLGDIDPDACLLGEYYTRAHGAQPDL